MTTSVLPAVPAKVAAFAAQAGVSEFLPAVLEMTSRVFPGVPVRLLVEDDPEIADDQHIVLEVDVNDYPLAQMVDSRNRWVRELFQHCPATHVCVFRIGVV